MGLVDQGLEIDVEHHAHRSLGIAVHDKNPETPQGKIIGKVLARGRFADTALEILNGTDDHSLGRQFAHLYTERFANRVQILERVISAPVTTDEPTTEHQ